MKRLMLVLIAVTISASFAYAGMDDKSDRLSSSQSSVFSPGYINAVKQHADEIAKQSSGQKGNFWENAVEYVKDKLSKKVDEGAADKPTVKLQKKTSSTGDPSLAAKKQEEPAVYAAAPQGSVVIDTNTKIDIGSGTLKHYDNGRMVSEYINGVKYIYVGFNNVGYQSSGSTNAVQSAINEATNDDVIIMRGGADKSYIGNITISGSVHVYGGFDETGQRNTAANPTNISGNITITNAPTVEMNRVSVTSGTTIVNSGSNLYSMGSSFNTVLDYGGMYGSNGSSWGNAVIMGGFGSGPNNFTVSSIRGQTKQVLVEKAPGSSVAINTLTYNYEDILKSQKASDDKYVSVFSNNINTERSISTNNMLSTMNAFLKGNDPVLAAKGQGTAAKNDSLAGNALAVPMLTAEEMARGADGMKLALVLANILKNPTEDQKFMIDSIMSLMKDVNKQETANQSPEVKKAQDDLIQVVANILIAQAIPDLLKEGDMSNIKSIFKDMSEQKDKLMLEYNMAVEPYYKEVKKVLAKNLAILQLNNIVSKTMVEEELDKLEPNDIDQIMDKLRKAANKSFEENYILQEETKLHSKYIDPNKKIYEDKLKIMLESFTTRLSKILEATKK